MENPTSVEAELRLRHVQRLADLDGTDLADDETMAAAWQLTPRYLADKNDDGTLLFTLAEHSDDPHLAQMSRSELRELFRRDSDVRLELAGGPTPETAALRLACLPLGQAGRWGPPDPAVRVDHPRFAEAVEAAAALDDEQQALDAATAILEGPEALKASGFAP